MAENSFLVNRQEKDPSRALSTENNCVLENNCVQPQDRHRENLQEVDARNVNNTELSQNGLSTENNCVQPQDRNKENLQEMVDATNVNITKLSGNALSTDNNCVQPQDRHTENLQEVDARNVNNTELYRNGDGTVLQDVNPCTSGYQQQEIDQYAFRVQEFLHIMSDKKAAIQAEIGHGKIEEEDVHVIPEDLLPHAELLLTIDIQAKAKKYFTSDAWKTVESTLTILEDLHLRKIKNKEFPRIVSMDKGKGKSSLQAPSEPNDVHCEVQNNPERDWISIAKQNEHKLQQFIGNHKPSKSLPSIGERIETVTNYEDHTKFLTEEQRTKITNFLCSKFNKLRIPTAKITYLLHDTISYLVNDFKFKDFQFKDTNDPRMEETTCLENEKAEVKLTQIRMPAKMRIKGRPKGSGQTIIGLAKKSTANTRKQKPKPFFKRCTKEKEKAILEWIVGSDLTKETCTNGKILEEKDVQKECLPGACVDSYVDMELVKHFFSSDGWTKVDMLLEKKRKHIDYNCDICLKSIDVGIVNVVCDSCLNVYHLPCVGLKSIPKSKHWFCNKCK